MARDERRITQPSNVFANTGTNVSVLLFDKSALVDKVILIDAGKLGEEYYSLSAGQYFDIKIEYVDITEDELNQRMAVYEAKLTEMFAESHRLESEILAQL